MPAGQVCAGDIFYCEIPHEFQRKPCEIYQRDT